MPKFKKDIVSRFPALSTIGVLGIVFVAIALQSKQIYDNPVILGDIFVPLLIIYSVNFLVSTVAGRIFFKRGDAVALVIAISYIIQVQSAAWYVKFADTIFGLPPEEALA